MFQRKLLKLKTIVLLWKQRSDVQMCSDIWQIESSSSLGTYSLGITFSITPCFALILLVVLPGGFLLAVRHYLFSHCFLFSYLKQCLLTLTHSAFCAILHYYVAMHQRVSIAVEYMLKLQGLWFLTPFIHTYCSWFVYYI